MPRAYREIGGEHFSITFGPSPYMRGTWEAIAKSGSCRIFAYGETAHFAIKLAMDAMRTKIAKADRDGAARIALNEQGCPFCGKTGGRMSTESSRVEKCDPGANTEVSA